MRQRIRFVGRVQGVGFRATTRTICRHHQVVGFVRNEPDGSVLMEIQGDLSVIDAVLTELRQVMRRNIHSEDVVPLADQGGETGFVIQS